MTFPLPVAAFEDYMLADDRPAYPMNFFIRMKFSGTIDQQAAEEALREVAKRHPLMTSQIRDRGRRKARWVRADAAARIPFHSITLEDPSAFPACQGLDIESAGGLVGYRVPSDSGDYLVWHFHHACCDGLGSSLVLEDWLTAYAAIVGVDVREGARRELDENRLRGRGRFGLSFWRFLKKSRKQAVGLLGVRKFLMRRPAPLLPDRVTKIDSELSVPYPVAMTHMFSLSQTRGLRAIAKRSECTVNDVLARDLFLAIDRFRDRLSAGSDEDWIRLSVPVNLRRAADRSLPAANVVSLVFLDRRRPDGQDAAAMLQSIHEEMQLIKTHELGLTFVLSLAVARRLPGGLKKQGDRYRCTATCLFTNPGPVFRRSPLPRDEEHRVAIGDVVLEALDLVAPIRPFTGAAFTLFNYARRQGVTLSYDPRMLTATEAAELLRDYVECVEASL